MEDFHSDRTQSTDEPKRISVDELYGKNPFSRLMIQMISRPVEHLMWRLVRNTQAVLANHWFKIYGGDD